MKKLITVLILFFVLSLIGVQAGEPLITSIQVSNRSAFIEFNETLTTAKGWYRITNSVDNNLVESGSRSFTDSDTDTISYVLPYGNFTFRYKIVASVGNDSATLDETVTIANPAPSTSTTAQQGTGDIGITTPMVGQIISSNVVITGTANMNNIKDVKVGYTYTAEQDCAKVSSWIKVSSQNGGWSLNWAIEELNLASGMYFIYAKATDTSGNYICAGGVLVYVKEIKNVTDVSQETAVTIKTLMCDGELCSEPEVGQEIGFVFEEQTVWRLYLDDNVLQEGSEGGDTGGSYTIASGGKYSLRTGSNYLPVKNFTVIGAKATVKAKDYVDLFNVTCYPACTKQPIQGEGGYAYICPLGTNISCDYNENLYFRVVRLSDGYRVLQSDRTSTHISFTPDRGDVFELLASKTLDTGYKSFRQFEIVAYDNPFFNFWAYVFYAIVIGGVSIWYGIHVPIVNADMSHPYKLGGHDVKKIVGVTQSHLLEGPEGKDSISLFTSGWLLQKLGRAGKSRHYVYSGHVVPTSAPMHGLRGLLFERESFTLSGPLVMVGPEPYFDNILNRTFQESFYGIDNNEIETLRKDVAALRTRDMKTMEEGRIKHRLARQAETLAVPKGTDQKPFSREEVMREIEELRKRIEEGE